MDGDSSEAAFVIAGADRPQLEACAARLLQIIAETAAQSADTCACCADAQERAQAALAALGWTFTENSRSTH